MVSQFEERSETIATNGGTEAGLMRSEEFGLGASEFTDGKSESPASIVVDQAEHGMPTIEAGEYRSHP